MSRTGSASTGGWSDRRSESVLKKGLAKMDETVWNVLAKTEESQAKIRELMDEAIVQAKDGNEELERKALHDLAREMARFVNGCHVVVNSVSACGWK